MTAFRVTESSGSAGTIQVAGEYGSFKPGRILAGANVNITSSSNGDYTIAAVGGAGTTIGTPSDGTYTDGLFGDFTSTTTIADAIDRLNQILSVLAPSPAPALDDISTNVSGLEGKLSFGTSNTITNFSNVGTGAGFSAVDVNGTYDIQSDSNNLRRGIFDGTQVIEGKLNEDIASASPNYPADAFGNGNLGILKLELNGTVIHTVDLTSFTGVGTPGNGTGISTGSNGSGFYNVSATGDAVDSNGIVFDSIKHRTANFRVATADQRSGWNYVRVLHTIGAGQTATNYIEWVNDTNTDPMGVSNATSNINVTEGVSVSGIKFLSDFDVSISFDVDNFYKNIHGSTISFASTNATAPSTITPDDIGPSEDETKVITVNTSVGDSNQLMLNQNFSTIAELTHPLKGLVTSTVASGGGFLLYNLPDNATNLRETFRHEAYRVRSGSYDTQSHVTATTASWVSSIPMTTASFYVNNWPGHSDGLQVLSGDLLVPTAYLSGDYRNTAESGSITFAPNGNPDYSGLTTGLRTYYRKFQNTGAAVRDFKITFVGSFAIANGNYALSGNRVSIYAKLPNNGTNQTGWLDISKAFVYNTVNDYEGCYVASNNATISGTRTNFYSFGTVEIGTDDYIVLKIEADATWTGMLREVEVEFGAGEGTLNPVPDLSQIDGAHSRTSDIRLSFGASNPVTGYTSVSAIGSHPSYDVNDTYTKNGNVLGVFDGTITHSGLLNPHVGNAAPSYVAGAFSEGNQGTLKLEVNGNIVYDLSIAEVAKNIGQGNPGSGYGTYTNADDTGFYFVSLWDVSKYSGNNVPDWTEIYRTARYQVGTNDQRNGLNYVRVIHSGSWGERETNYVQWVNDNDSTVVTHVNSALSNFEGHSFYYLSGVKYFTQCSGSFTGEVQNAYNKVYSGVASAVLIKDRVNMEPRTLIVSGSGIVQSSDTLRSSVPLPPLRTDVSSPETLPIFVTSSLRFSQTTSYPSDNHTASMELQIMHPLKGNVVSSLVSKSKFLVFSGYSGGLSSDVNYNEYFLDESYRLVSGSYNTQSDVTSTSNEWNSEYSMDDTVNYADHSTGLLYFKQELIAPSAADENGDFRNVQEGGTIQSPYGNPNYSTLSNGTREFYRAFKNNTTADKPNVTIKLTGDATIVGRSGLYSGTLGANKNIHVDVKVPGKCGFLDMGRPSAGSGNILEGDGGLSGNLAATVAGNPATNICTFNGVTADGTASSAGEYIVVRIQASEDWTGSLSRIQVVWS
jgi:hypothetical protein